MEYIEDLEVDTLWVYYTASDGSQRRIVVNAAVLKNHKNALKNLLVKYEKGAGWKGVSLNGKKHYEEDTQRTKIVSNEGHNVYGLASGWRYDFPWIETVTLTEEEGWGKNPTYLHYGSAGVANIETEADDDNKCYHIKGLEGYDYDDIWWRRMTRNGALAGIVTGAVTVLVWNHFAWFGLYEILPGFVFGIAAIVIVSLLDKAPSKRVADQFTEVERIVRDRTASTEAAAS